MGKTKSTSVPSPTSAETYLTNLQTLAAIKNNQMTEATMPLLLNSAGIASEEVPVTTQDYEHFLPDKYLAANPDVAAAGWAREDPWKHWTMYGKKEGRTGDFWDTTDTKYRKMTDDEYYGSLSGLDKQSYDIQKLALERQLKAYNGELEIDPYVERTLAEEDEQAKERILRNLGPGGLESTAGSNTLADLASRKAETRYQVAHGEMTGQEAIAESKSNRASQNINDLISRIGAGTNSLLNSSQAASLPLSWYAQRRQQQQAANQANMSAALTQRGQNLSFISSLLPKFQYQMGG